MKKYLIVVLLNFVVVNIFAQTNISGIINDYASVTNIISCNNQIEIADASAFSVGDTVLLVQMKGATMNTTNTAAFGDLISLNNAGNYEYNTISNISGTTITFLNTLAHAYNVTGIVQLVRIPSYSGNVTVTATLTAQAWNGTTGGILAFNVGGTITLNADIDVSEQGFRGGVINNTINNCNWFLTPDFVSYFHSNGTEFAAGKGEGIVEFVAGMGSARGKQLNGGGGGNDSQTGGGGGAGFGTGGIGGINNEPSSFICDGNYPGIGGDSLNYVDRYIFSGAGGAGHGNTFSSFAGNAGGLIYIKANAIIPNGFNVLANGQDGNDGVVVDNDGGAGGGAGGIIILDINSSTDFNVSATGGNGSSTDVFGGTNGRCYGPGGGAGGGLILTPASLTFTANVSGGTAGIITNSSSTNGCNGTTAGATNGGAGASITTIFPNSNFGFAFVNSTIINDTICSNQNYTLPNGSIVNNDTTFIDTLLNVQACDSIVEVNLVVYQAFLDTLYQSSCNASDTGTFVVNDSTIFGCDSITTLIVSLLQGSLDTIYSSSCNIADTGTILFTDTTSFGCDSNTLQITNLLPSYNDSIYSSSCNTADTGIFIVNDTTSFGCDSITTTLITFVTAYSDTTYATSCNFADTGTIIVNDTTSFGCDSITTLITSLSPSYSDTTYATSCNTADTGTLILNDTTSFGCDSIYTIITSLLNSHLDTIYSSSCNITDTGTILFTDTTSFGCDSNTLQITNLLPSYNDSIYSSSCSAADTGIFIVSDTTSFGCDSITTSIISLLVNHLDTIYATSCNPLDTGITILNDTTNLGCDSITISIIRLIAAVPSSVNVSICNGSTHTLPSGNIVSLAGMYIDTVNSVLNCDSIITTNLSILSDTVQIISEPEDIVICPEGPGFSFELNFDALNISTYQWQIDTGFGFVNLNDIENFNGSNTGILTVSVPFENIDGANFRLQYTDDCGNGATSSVYNSRISTPDPVNGIGDATFCQREIELIEVDYDGTDYIWNDGTTGRFIEPTESGAYIVNFMQNSSSCMAADTINVIIEDCVAECVVTAPTGFSPDGKAFNNTFKAIYTCELDYFEMLIVNRWGEVVFESDNVTNAWDGTYKNKPVPIGIYSWYIKYNKVGENNRQSLSGTVTLIR
ncbi:MAG: gliding motility-associated C-terminal domain-containing protein [Chitinophagales bacterium]